MNTFIQQVYIKPTKNYFYNVEKISISNKSCYFELSIEQRTKVLQFPQK